MVILISGSTSIIFFGGGEWGKFSGEKSVHKVHKNLLFCYLYVEIVKRVIILEKTGRGREGKKIFIGDQMSSQALISDCHSY